MSAAEVLAQYVAPWTTTTDGPTNIANRILAALKAAGYAVVELPTAIGTNGNDNRVWCQNPYIEQEFGGDVIISDRLGIDAAELRNVAIVLLAAADAAEAQSC